MRTPGHDDLDSLGHPYLPPQIIPPPSPPSPLGEAWAKKKFDLFTSSGVVKVQSTGETIINKGQQQQKIDRNVNNWRSLVSKIHNHSTISGRLQQDRWTWKHSMDINMFRGFLLLKSYTPINISTSSRYVSHVLAAVIALRVWDVTVRWAFDCVVCLKQRFLCCHVWKLFLV